MPISFSRGSFSIVFLLNAMSDWDAMTHEEHWDFERNGYEVTRSLIFVWAVHKWE